MWEWLLKTGIGMVLGPVLNAGVDVAKAKIMADGSIDEHTANMTVEALRQQTAQYQLQTALLAQEQGNWLTRWVRPMWAFPFVYVTWRYTVVDPLFDLTSPPLSDQMTQLLWIVAPSYFIGRSAEKITQYIVGRGKK